MKVLVACEFSGVVRDAFKTRGHDAISCDLLPSDSPGEHYCGNVLDIINEQWDLMIAHPPCTHLSSSGARWFKDKLPQQQNALLFVRRLFDADHIPKICIENPIGILSTRIRKPDQIIQPHQFGHDASKATCLWLKGLPKLEPTEHVMPRIVNGKKRWANQTDSGQNRLPPSADRGQKRAITYQGIAEAMALQWG